MTAYMMFGIHTDNSGGKTPPLANSSAKRINKMYEKHNPNPIPMWSPVPPRTLRDEIATPIRVSTNVDIG